MLAEAAVAVDEPGRLCRQPSATTTPAPQTPPVLEPVHPRLLTPRQWSQDRSPLPVQGTLDTHREVLTTLSREFILLESRLTLRMQTLEDQLSAVRLDVASRLQAASPPQDLQARVAEIADRLYAVEAHTRGVSLSGLTAPTRQHSHHTVRISDDSPTFMEIAAEDACEMQPIAQLVAPKLPLGTKSEGSLHTSPMRRKDSENSQEPTSPQKGKVNCAVMDAAAHARQADDLADDALESPRSRGGASPGHGLASPSARKAATRPTDIGIRKKNKWVMPPLGDKYALRETVWDAALFCGYSRLKLWESAFVALSVAVSISLQIAFCVVITVGLTRDPYGDILEEDLVAWRRGASKAVARGVCDGGYQLSTGGLQAALTEAMRDYTGPGNMQIGRTLACLVVTVWTLSVADALWCATDYVKAVVTLLWRHGSASLEVCSAAGDGGGRFRIKGLTRFHAGHAIVLGVVEILILLCLLISGSLWLSRTTSLPELLASSVALAHVLRVDFIVYRVLVPWRVKCLVAHMEPIDVAMYFPEGSWRRRFTTAACVLGFVLLYVLLDIFPRARRLLDLRDALCPQ